jgi:hypothetical protein
LSYLHLITEIEEVDSEREGSKWLKQAEIIGTIVLYKYMDHISDKKESGESKIGLILSAIKGREGVGNAKKGVNLLSIVQKLTSNREKNLEDNPSDA